MMVVFVVTHTHTVAKKGTIKIFFKTHCTAVCILWITEKMGRKKTSLIGLRELSPNTRRMKVLSVKRREREKCLLPNGRAKFLQEEKIKDDRKQKQDESLSFWKEHSETMVLNEIQFLTKIFSVLHRLLLCRVYQDLCFIFPKRASVLYFLCCTSLRLSSPLTEI